MSTILRHLARWGYVVISSDASEAFPGTAFQEGVLVGSLEYLIAENGRSGSPFHDRLRTHGVVLMGHSTGGGAALLAGGSTALDVGAIATLVPSGPSAPAAAIPTLVVGVSRDDGTFGGNAGNLYAQADPPKHHVHIVGANHFGFTDDLCFGSDGEATISRDDQQRIAAAYLTAFLQQYVGGDASYARMLDGSLPIESLEPFDIEVEAEV
jgi:hypothetical protein